MVVAPIYDFVVPFSEGLAVIKIGEKFGYIDTDGKIVIQPKFDFAESFSHSRALVSSSKGYHALYLDARGISQAWCPHHTDDWVDPTECVTAPHREDDTYAAWSSSARDDAKYGFIDKHGKCVIPMVYGHAQRFSDGLALVEDFPMRNYGYIDTTGKFRIRMRSGHGQPFSEGLAVVMPASAFELNPSSDVHSFVIDGQGKVRHFSPGHFFCVRFSSGLTAFGSDDGLYGFYRTNLKIGIAPTYDEAENFSEGLAVVAVADLHKISSNESARKAYKLGLRPGPPKDQPNPSSPADEIAAFNRAIEADPSCGAAVFERAKKFVEAGKKAEAITDFARSIELGYKPVESSIRSARIQSERFRAIENFNKCLELYPEFVSILISRGQLHAALGDDESAVSDLTKAIRIHELRYGLTSAGDKKSKFEFFESFPDYEKQTKESLSRLANSATVSGLQPSYNERKLCCKYSLLDAITIRAQSYVCLGRLDDAAKDYNHVCALAPSESRREFVNFRKDCLLQMKRYDLAEKDLTELLTSEPYTPHLLRERAYTYLKMGRFVDVVRDCDAFLEEQPNCGRSLYLRSQAFFHLNNLRRASLDLARARQLGYKPEFTEIMPRP
ncbi:MAG: WG repeat-containing protein [Candidatus Obscuribacterales bacterium]|nr:WG repeat-containing protein [Candidatus Obscuribacterales bacterium]